MPQERATPEEHAREIARMHTLIERIQLQAEALQQAAHHLPPAEAGALSEKADTLVQQADEVMDAVEALEARTS